MPTYPDERVNVVFKALPKEFQDYLDGKTKDLNFARDKQVGGDHYRKMNPQPIDLLKSWLSPDEFSGFLRGNVIKYLARYKEKGGVQDLEKARQYLEWLIDLEKGNEH